MNWQKQQIVDALEELRLNLGSSWGCHWLVMEEVTGGRVGGIGSDVDICFWPGAGRKEITGSGATLEEAWAKFGSAVCARRAAERMEKTSLQPAGEEQPERFCEFTGPSVDWHPVSPLPPGDSGPILRNLNIR